MPIAMFSIGGAAPRLGKVIGDRIVDLSQVAADLPGDVIGFLSAGAPALEAFRAITGSEGSSIAIDEVRLHAPIPRPEKYLAIGMNYADHAAEGARLGYEIPEFQLWFNKQVSCVVGPHDDIVMPRVSSQLDFEGELAVVIGTPCRHVGIDDALSFVGGYMIANDVSVRDWQRRSPTMTLGKSFDTHGPTGPWLSLSHEVDDPQDLRLRTIVNGVERQNDVTANMVHGIAAQIAYLSTVMTLRPGDILATGTPSGAGVAADPPRFLDVGDVVRVEIDGLGHIENRIVAEG